MFSSGNIKKRQLPAKLNWTVFKMNSTILYAQTCMPQKNIRLLFWQFRYSPPPPPLLRSADSTIRCKSSLVYDYSHYTTYPILHVSVLEVVREREVRWPRGPGLWANTSTMYEEVVFTRGGSKREGGSQELITHSTVQYLATLQRS